MTSPVPPVDHAEIVPLPVDEVAAHCAAVSVGACDALQSKLSILRTNSDAPVFV